MKRLISANQNGSILLVFLISLPFLILIATYYMQLSLTSLQVATQDQRHSQAQLSADAGADYAIEQISLNNAWAGTAGEVTLHNETKIRTTYAVTVVSNTVTKTLLITGRSYAPASATSPARSVKIAVDLRPVTKGSFGVISGEGGLFMSNSSKIVGGDVFINGEISLSNTAQIGLSTTPLNVSVAHQICPVPPDATYPRVCNSGEHGQPITINGPSAHIYGTVKATNQTTGTSMTNPGLVAGTTVTPQPLPTYNRAAQKAAVTTNLTGTAASCGGTQTLVWPANTKITGNVTIGIKCRVTVQGNVWITGSLAMSNSSQLVVADALGASVPNIMIDGAAGATFSNSSQLVSNASGTGFEIFTFWSAGACSPDCATQTASDLYNSRAVTTINLQQSSSAPNTIFYAYWSQVSIGNSGQIGALIGQTIQMNNSGTLTFGAAVDVGGPTIYVVQGYRKQ